MWEELKFLAHKADWMKTFVGVAFIGTFIYLVAWVLMQPIPEGNKEIAHFIAGEVTGVALTIAYFYYGSSKGSQEKSDIIKDHMAEKKKEIS